MVTGLQVEDKEPITFGSKNRFLGFCNRCSIIVFFFALVFAALFITFVVLYTQQQSKLTAEADKSKVTHKPCVTADCLTTAADMMRDMDTSVEPCDDFYSYACGRWKDRHFKSTRTDYHSVLQQMIDGTYEKVESLLSDGEDTFEPNSLNAKLMRLFRVCFTHYSRKDSVQNFVTHMTTALNGSYLFEPESIDSTWNFQNALENSHIQFKSNYLFKIDVVPTFKGKTTLTQLQFEPIFLIARWYQKESEYSRKALNTYTSYMRKVLQSASRDIGLGLTPEHTNKINTFIADVLEVEKNFAPTSLLPLHGRSAYSTISNITNMLNNTVDFLKYYENVFGKNLNFSSQTSVFTWSQQQLDSFASSLLSLQKNNSFHRMMNNYISWRLFHAHIHTFPSKYAHLATPVLRLMGDYDFPGFWQICFEKVTKSMDKAVLHLYVGKYLAPTTRNDVAKMVTYIKKGVLSLINRLWNKDEDLKQKIKEKITAMKTEVGYSSWIENKATINQYYQQLNITEDNIENEINVNKFLLAKKAELIKDGMELNNWDNVFTYNIIVWTRYPGLLVVPATLLQRPLFHPRDNYFKNMGALGRKIASGLFSFVYNNVYDWKPDSRKIYDEQLQCFRDQSETIKVGPYIVNGVNKTVDIPNPNPSGRLLQHHFFAQQVVLEAYKAWLQDSKIDDMLPGFRNATPEGMLFLSSSQSYCEVLTLQEIRTSVNARKVPEQWAINAVLANSPQFQKAFSCKKGSPMVAEKTCY